MISLALTEKKRKQAMKNTESSLASDIQDKEV
jgi:hypothetical protein